MKHPTDEEIEKELRKQLRSWDTHVGISAGEAYINGFKACAKWARDQQSELDRQEIERLKKIIEDLKFIIG